MASDLAPTPSYITGPTWQKTLDGRWHLPERTLGWGILDWWAEYVKSPGGPTAGQAFMPTLEQARFTLWWYEVDELGNYCCREGVLRRLKGWGKDPFAAALSLAELAGPVAFSHFAEDGTPVGKQRHAPWVQIAAVSKEQTENTFSMFPVMVSEKMKRDFRMEMNKFLIYSGGGVGRIQAVTSSPASMEGKRPTFIVLNEIQWWGTGPSGEINEGHAMAGVIKGNMDKILEARSLAICNAHVPGNDSLGERYYDRWQKIAGGLEVDTGLLYDSLEAPSDTPVSEIPSKMEDPDGFELGFKQLRVGLEVARGDSVWLPLDKIALSVLDSMTPITESRRKFLNQVNAAEDSWIAPHEWDRCVRDTAKGDVPLRPLERGDQISLGFDGSKSSDHTALCACRIDDGAIFLIKTWVPDNYPGSEIPRDDVDAYVRSIFEKYDVVSFRADVKEFESYVDKWGKDFKRKIKVNASPNNPVAYDMRGQQKKFSFDCERFLDAVLERELVHDGNLVLRQHVLNAHRHPTNWEAVTIRKASRDSSRKIDAAVTAVLAFGGRQEFLMSKSSRGRGAVVLR